MIADGCGRNDGCENYERQKHINSLNNEKTTSSAPILGGKDVNGMIMMLQSS